MIVQRVTVLESPFGRQRGAGGQARNARSGAQERGAALVVHGVEQRVPVIVVDAARHGHGSTIAARGPRSSRSV